MPMPKYEHYYQKYMLEKLKAHIGFKEKASHTARASNQQYLEKIGKTFQERQDRAQKRFLSRESQKDRFSAEPHPLSLEATPIRKINRSMSDQKMSKTWMPVNHDLANLRGTLDPINESKIKNKFVRVANNSPDYYSSDQNCLKITSESTISIVSVLELLFLRLSKNIGIGRVVPRSKPFSYDSEKLDYWSFPTLNLLKLFTSIKPRGFGIPFKSDRVVRIFPPHFICYFYSGSIKSYPLQDQNTVYYQRHRRQFILSQEFFFSKNIYQSHFLFSVDIQSLDQKVLKNSVSLKRLQKDVQLLRIARSILQDEKDQTYRESTIARLKQMNERYQRISRKLKKGSVRMSSEAIDKNRSDIATEEIITQEETIPNQDSIQQRQLDEAQSRNYSSLIQIIYLQFYLQSNVICKNEVIIQDQIIICLIGTSLPAAESFIRQGPSDYRFKKNRKLVQSAHKPRNNQTFFYRTQYRPDPQLTQSHQYEYAQHFNTKALNMDQRITYQSQNQEDSRTTEPETNSCLYRSRPFTGGQPFDGIPILTPDDNTRPTDEQVLHKRRRVKTAGTRNLPDTLSSSKLTRMSKNLLCYVQDQPKMAPILLSQFSRKIMRQKSPCNEMSKFRKRVLF